MICPNCGVDNPDSSYTCSNCGRELQSFNDANQYPNTGDQYGNQPSNYGNQPPSYGNQPPNYGNQPPGYGNQPPSYGNQQPGDSKATMSMIFGIISLVCCGSLLFSILAIVFSNMAKKEGYVGGKAKGGMIMGIVSLIIGGIVVILYSLLIALEVIDPYY